MPNMTEVKYSGTTYKVADLPARSNISDLEIAEIHNILGNVTYTEGYIVRSESDFVPQANADYKYSNFIKVIPGTKYIFNKNGRFVNFYRSASFDEPISQADPTTLTSGVVVPDGAAYMVLSCTLTAVFYGSIDGFATFIYEYAKEKLNNINPGNVFYNDGYIVYSGSNYKPQANADYKYSNFIRAIPGATYYFNKNGRFVNFYGSASFDDWIAQADPYTLQDGIVAPSNARYMVLSGTITAEIFASIRTSITQIENAITGTYAGIPTYTEGYIVREEQGHTPVENADYKYSNFIKVTPGAKIYFNKNGRFVNFYRSESFNDWVKEADPFSLVNGTLIPNDAEYMVLSCTISAEMIFYVESAPNKTIRIGAGQEYETLKDGFAAASISKNATVIIYPGTYDLTEEFENEIENHSGSGLFIGNGNRYVFMAGSYVKALFSNTDRWVYDYFEPFHVNSTDFTLEGLNIEASNTRYCVHDECGGVGKYTHRFTDCTMKYTNTHEDINYVQCIGGGLGEHGTIIIDGGNYESATDYGIPSTDSGNKNSAQQAISYHNGNNANCDCKIIIKNVYLKNRGYFRFGWYGPSSIESQIQICGCSTGLPTLVKSETSGNSNPVNFALTEFCNEKRNAYHWELSQQGYIAALVAD